MKGIVIGIAMFFAGPAGLFVWVGALSGDSPHVRIGIGETAYFCALVAIMAVGAALFAWCISHADLERI